MTCKACEDAAKVTRMVGEHEVNAIYKRWRDQGLDMFDKDGKCIGHPTNGELVDHEKIDEELLKHLICFVLIYAATNVAPQSSTATSKPAPSPEGVGQGEIASAAPYAELVELAATWERYASDNSGRHPWACETLYRCAKELREATGSIAKLAKGE